MSTKIEWTNETWNPVVGCTIVSPGCTNCYAMKMAHRIGPNFPHYAGLTTLTKGGPVWTGKVATAPDAIFLQPLSWKRPRRIFVNSMSDLFHEDVAEATIDRVFAVMALTPHHTYQVLTKRAERMRDYSNGGWRQRVRPWLDKLKPSSLWNGNIVTAWGNLNAGPLPNVWLGVSAEDQRRAEERIPLLLDTPAAVRWVSAEPLLGPVDLTRLAYGPGVINGLAGYADGTQGRGGAQTKLDWIVAGGESGPGSRPAHPDWFRSLRYQCAGAGVPFFFKQWGDWLPCTMDNPSDGSGWLIYPDDESIELGDRRFKTANAHGKEFFRMGKRAAGHVLDGAVHQAWPQ